MVTSLVTLFLAGQLSGPIVLPDPPTGATEDQPAIDEGIQPRAAPATPMNGPPRTLQLEAPAALPESRGLDRPVDVGQAAEPSARNVVPATAVEAGPEPPRVPQGFIRPEGAVAEALRLWKATHAQRFAELAVEELPLKACVRQRSLGADRLAVVRAYWNLSAGVARWNAVHQQRQRLETIPATQRAYEQQLLTAARAAVETSVATATVNLVQAQSELLELLDGPSDLRHPLPVDPPHLDRYLTKLDQLYNGQAPATLQRLDDLLIRRQTQMDACVLGTLEASEAWRLCEAAYRQGDCSLAPLLQADALLYQQQLAFLDCVRQYNHEIARFAFEVGGAVQDPDVVVSMLIKNAVEPDPERFPYPVNGGLTVEPNPVPLEPLPLRPIPATGQPTSAQPSIVRPGPSSVPPGGQPAGNQGFTPRTPANTPQTGIPQTGIPQTGALQSGVEPRRLGGAGGAFQGVVPASAEEPLPGAARMPVLPPAVQNMPSVLIRRGTLPRN